MASEMRFLVTDHCDNKEYECEGRFELEELLLGLFDTEQEGVTEAIDHVVSKMCIEDTTWAESFLNISVEAL